MDEAYLSPYSNRYRDHQLDHLWSQRHQVSLWVRIWCLTALDDEKQGQLQLTDKQVGNLQSAAKHPLSVVDDRFMAAMADRESVTRHDVVAALQVAEETLEASGKLHVGFTSSDVQDIATSQILLDSQHRILDLLGQLLLVTTKKAATAEMQTPVPGYTHLQIAEPTTMTHRLVGYLEQLNKDTSYLRGYLPPSPIPNGAVGTHANRCFLGGYQHIPNHLGQYISGQTYPRTEELRLLGHLCQIAATLSKMAIDFRFLASTGLLEGTNLAGQIGSSAMPGKVNPIGWEKINSLTRRMPGMYQELWTTSASSVLERTLDDSAIRRSLLPEMFMVMAECIKTATREIPRVHINAILAHRLLLRSWKVWVGSRVNTHLQSINAGISRECLDKLLGESHSWVDFLFAADIELHNTIDSLEQLYQLDYIQEEDAAFIRQMATLNSFWRSCDNRKSPC